MQAALPSCWSEQRSFGASQQPRSWAWGNFGLMGCYPHCCAPNLQPQGSTAALHTPEPGHGGKKLWRHRHSVRAPGWELGKRWGWGAGSQQQPGDVWESTAGRCGGTERWRRSLLAPSAAGIRVDAAGMGLKAEQISSPSPLPAAFHLEHDGEVSFPPPSPE